MKLMRWSVTAILLTCAVVLTSCLSTTEVKIGVIIPEKGSLAGYGYQIRSGIQMAQKEALANTDLKKDYQLIWENEDETNLDGIRSSFMRLKEQGCRAIIGPASSAGTLELVELANENQIILLSPASSSPEINTGTADFIYRNYPSDTLEAQSLANTVFQKIRLQKVLVVRAENVFSSGIAYEFLKFGRGNSRHIPNRVVKFDPDPSKVTWSAVVDDIETMAPHGLFLAAYTDQLIPLIREIRSRESLKKVFLFTCSSFVLNDAIEELGKELLEDLMFTAYPWDPNDPTNTKVQEFAEKFNGEYLVQPGIFAATGYDAFNMLVETFENAPHGLADELKDYMNKTNFNGLLGETDFNKSGNVTRIPRVYRIANGVKEEVSKERLQELRELILTEPFYDLTGN